MSGTGLSLSDQSRVPAIVIEAISPNPSPEKHRAPLRTKSRENLQAQAEEESPSKARNKPRRRSSAASAAPAESILGDLPDPAPATASSVSIKSNVFGRRSVIKRIDVNQPCPDSMTMFEFCCRVYFKAVWDGHQNATELPKEYKRFFDDESFESLVQYALNYFESDVQAIVNSRVFPDADKMAQLGFLPPDWLEEKSGGGYCGVVQPEPDSDMRLGYGGSTNKASRRIGSEHSNREHRQKEPRNPLYKAIDTGREFGFRLLYHVDFAFQTQDEFAPVRLKLLESLMLALFALYDSAHHTRVQWEVHLAQLWSKVPLQSRDDFVALDQQRHMKATNKSIPYAEEARLFFDPYKRILEGCPTGLSNNLQLYTGQNPYRYYFTLTTEQLNALTDDNFSKYGLLQVQQTADGTAHPHQYALDDDDAHIPEYEDAATYALSFTYPVRDSNGQRTGATREIWLQPRMSYTAARRESSALGRACFILSLKEHIPDSVPAVAGPNRFALPGTESTKDNKIWVNKKVPPPKRDAFKRHDVLNAFLKADSVKHIDNDTITCPWCGIAYIPGEGPYGTLLSKWFYHVKKKLSCKRAAMEAAGVTEDDEPDYAAVYCHCGEEFPFQKDRKKHMFSQKHKSCRDEENRILALLDQPLLVPPTCRGCQQTFQAEDKLRVHLWKPKFATCLATEVAYRTANGLPALKSELQYCQQDVCGKYVEDKQVVDAPGTRFSSAVFAHMALHYEMCHTGVKKPGKKALMKNPDEDGDEEDE